MHLQKHYIFFFGILFLYRFNLFGQENIKIQNSESIEVGALYGQINWHGVQTSYTFNRNELIIFPTARLSLLFGVSSEIFINPFFGYARLGGKSAETDFGYKDEYRLETMEIGTFVGYRWMTFDFALAGKFNSHVEKMKNVYTTSSSNLSPYWVESEETFYFKDYSADIGLRIAKNIDDWHIIGESWFGMTPLQKSELSEFVSIHQNSFRVLIGYSGL